MKNSLFFLLILISILFSSCSGLTNSPALATMAVGTPTGATRASATPVLESSPEPTVGVQPSVEISSTATQVPLTIDPTYFNLPSETPTPTLDPSLILLRIVSPGPMSKVVSPIDFLVHVAPYYTGATRILLVGEDGAELYRKEFKTYSNIGYFTRVEEKVQFQVFGAAEIGRLQISTSDDQGRILAFNSVRLLLQSVGDNQFLPPYPVQDRALIRFPLRDDQITGGQLEVRGEYKPANTLPAVLEILGPSGEVLGSTNLQFNANTGDYQQFDTVIPYTVLKATPVLLVLRQPDDRIEGLAYLFSLPVVIAP